MSVFLSKSKANVCLGYFCIYAYYKAGAHEHLWMEAKKEGMKVVGGGSGR